MSRLLKNLFRMTNTEKNNLAKNEYCDDAIQIWLAKNGNIQARYYLAENPSLCEEAKQIILEGKSVIAKGILVSVGSVSDTDLIKEIYTKMDKRSSTWRIMHFFVNNLYGRKRPTNTPSEVLEHIYENRLKGDSYYTSFWSEAMALHPNCSTRLAIMMSQSTKERVKQHGFNALVRLEREAK